jgi:Resolvase, N terminal domain
MATRSEKPLRFSQIDAETVTKGLARNVHFVSSLMESGVEFVAVDFPQANRLTIHILAAVAEHEAKAISERTKAALAAAKARKRQTGRLPWPRDRRWRSAGVSGHAAGRCASHRHTRRSRQIARLGAGIWTTRQNLCAGVLVQLFTRIFRLPDLLLISGQIGNTTD